jgi:hypothetical protein
MFSAVSLLLGEASSACAALSEKISNKLNIINENFAGPAVTVCFLMGVLLYVNWAVIASEGGNDDE